MMITRTHYGILGLAFMLASCGTVPSIRQDSASLDRPANIGVASRPSIGEVPWPTNTEAQSELEVLLQLPEGKPALESYQERAGKLTALCMADGGFTTKPGEPLSDEAHGRLSKEIVYRGATFSGGCDEWGRNYAFPGNFLSESYQPLRTAALQRPEYLAVLAEYDSCFRARGFEGPPNVNGLSDEQAKAAMAQYVDAGNSCDQAAGLTKADRAADLLVENSLVKEQRLEVEAYVTAILADLASVDSKGTQP